jgi:hypothetical protein
MVKGYPGKLRKKVLKVKCEYKKIPTPIFVQCGYREERDSLGGRPRTHGHHPIHAK